MKKGDRRRRKPQPKFCKPRWLIKGLKEVGLSALAAHDKDFPVSQLRWLVARDKALDFVARKGPPVGEVVAVIQPAAEESE